MGDMSGKKSTSSKSSNTTNTTNIDRRQVVAEGAFGIAADGATVNIESTDAGIVRQALDTVSAADATNGDGFARLLNLTEKTGEQSGNTFSKLLNLTEKLFDAGGAVLDKSAEASMAAVSAVSTAKNDAAGSIDQKTLIIMGAVGLGAAFLLRK